MPGASGLLQVLDDLWGLQVTVLPSDGFEKILEYQSWVWEKLTRKGERRLGWTGGEKMLFV
jgi:hypothetical protein